MPESKVTIPVDLDTTAVVAKTEAMKEKMGHAFDKVGKDGANSFEQVLTKMGKGLVIARAMSDAIKAGFEEYKKIKEEQKNIAESGISQRFGTLQNAQRLGLGAAALATIQTASGSTTESERAGFLGGLNENDNKNANRQALGLFSTGLFNSGELHEGIKNNTLDQLAKDRSKRESFLGSDYTRLRDLRDQQRMQDNAKFETVRDVQLGQSMSDRQAELTRLGNPVASGVAMGAQKALESLAGVNKVAGAALVAVEVGGSAAKELAGSSGYEVRSVRVVNQRLNMSGAKDSQ